jgi:hypothetical protein
MPRKGLLLGDNIDDHRSIVETLFGEPVIKWGAADILAEAIGIEFHVSFSGSFQGIIENSHGFVSAILGELEIMAFLADDIGMAMDDDASSIGDEGGDGSAEKAIVGGHGFGFIEFEQDAETEAEGISRHIGLCQP